MPLQVDERTSASSRQTHEGMTGAGERDLPKDAASLHWYDAEGTSYHSAESQRGKSNRAPRISSDTSRVGTCSLLKLCSSPQGLVVAHVIARE